MDISTSIYLPPISGTTNLRQASLPSSSQSLSLSSITSLPIIYPLQLCQVQAKYELSPADSAVFTKKAYKAEVVRVVDGDTIDVRIPEIGENYYVRVRYIGINAPELHHPRKGAEPFGREAADANSELVSGRKVTLKLDVQKRDKYDRLLAYVYFRKGLKKTFVNEWLIRSGYAQVSTFPPNVKHEGLFLEAQRYAMEHNLGLWGLENKAK